MKKIVLIIAIFLCNFLNAQIEFSNTRFGVIAGPNISAVTNAHNPSSRRTAFMAGMFAEVPIDFYRCRCEYNQLFIQAELLYVASGENGSKYDEKRKYHADYLSIPIFLKGYLTKTANSFYGYGGPRFGFLVNQNVVNPPGDRPYYAGEEGKAATFDFALAGGIGYSFNRKLEVSLRYELGLSNAYPDLDIDYEVSNDPEALKRKSQQIVSFGISYTFD